MTERTPRKPAIEGFVDRSRRATALGLLACMILIGGFGGWAATAKLSGAVVSEGRVVVSSELKAVQHPDGGIVGAINVKNGDRVGAGDIVLSLDRKMLEANRALLDDQLLSLEAKLGRLQAERDGQDDLVLPDAIEAAAAEPAAARALAAERAVMEARRLSREAEVSALAEQVAQLEQEIEGLKAQRSARDEEIVLIDQELSGITSLREKGLVPETRITALRRERTGLLGSSGALSAQIAVARGRISETRLKIVQLEKSFRETVMSEISALMPQVAQLKERRAAAQLQLSRVDVRAPADGVVHELAVHTVGGVVAPGDTLMRIVPDADDLLVTAKVAPKDINNLAINQPASVVIGAFDQKAVPRLEGTVSFISADLKRDPATGANYFEARIDLAESANATLADRALTLLPGMPAEVYVATGEHTMLDYLTNPLTKQIRNTFREP